MKTTALCIACLLAAAFSFAQAYHPMAQENAHWIIYAIGESGAEHYLIEVQGDTLVNGVSYKKTWHRPIQSSATAAQDFQPPFYAEPGSVIGAMRDDTLSKQVFYVPFAPMYTANDTCDLAEEWLIYDYSIGVGDLVGGCLQFPPDGQLFTVTEVATAFLWGENRKLINCEGSTKLVEGVGTEMGPFWQVFSWVHPAKPQFLYEYCVGSDSYCGIETVSAGNEQLRRLDAVVFPNPVFDRLRVQLPEPVAAGPFAMTVFDATGRALAHRAICQLPLELDVRQLVVGHYRIQLVAENWTASSVFFKK